MANVLQLYRNAFGGLSPATWWLSLVMLINRSGTMVVPFMTLYLTQSLHMPIAKAGLAMAIYGVGAVCGGILGGKLTDVFGFFNVQVASLAVGSVMFVVLGQMHDFYAICIAAFLLALLNDSFRPANTTAIAQYSTDKNRTRSFSLNRLAINLGWAVGSANGGFVAGHSYQLLFWIDGVTNMFAAVLLVMVLAPKRNSQTPSKAERAARERLSTSSPYTDTVYLFFILLTIVFAMCFFQLFTTVPVFFKTELLLEPKTIGAVMAFNGILIAVFEMFIVYKLDALKRKLTLIAIGLLFTGLSFLVLNLSLSGLLVALVSTVVVTVGEMLSMPFMNTFMISRTNEANRGQYAGLYSASWSVAQVFGPYGGSLLVATWGFGILWWAIGGLLIAGAAGFWWLQTVLKPNEEN